MKTICTSIVFWVLVFCGFSCKKDYTCQCETKNTDTNINSVIITTETKYKSVTKQAAKQKCTSYSEVKTSQGNTTTSEVNCKLK